MPQVVLNPNLDLLFLDWKQRYGGVFTLWVGPYPMVMVGDVEKMKLYFVRHADAFTGRWQNFITTTFMGGHNGIVQIQGDKWREQRRFTLHILRNLGLGKSNMEDMILTQVNALVHYLHTLLPSKSAETRSTEVTKPVAVCIANIINNILFGKTFAHDDASFVQLQHLLDQQSALVIRPVMGLYLTFPFTVNIPLVNSSWVKLMRIRNSLWAFLERQIQEHRAALDSTKKPTDFTFAYMMEILKRQKANQSMGHFRQLFLREQNPAYISPPNFSEKQLKMVLLDLFFAGSETTMTTTKWGILLLTLNPGIQLKCHEELDEVDGDTVKLRHRTQLTYLQATLCEIQRVANILPINLLRTCTRSIHLDSFHFPQGTMVLPQVSIAMNDPANFPQANLFQPERFLDKNQNTLKKPDAFLPFSLGKRQCLGESLARAELFLIFANLLKNFEFGIDRECEIPSTARQYGLTAPPKQFRCLLRARRRGGDSDSQIS